MDLYQEALTRIRDLLQQAAATDLAEPTAMTLATADGDGRPTARTVLLKAIDEQGFVFYTNTLSRKGRALAENPRAALCFFWQPLLAQVLVEGSVQSVSAAEADAYWATRPRISQIGAWASQQSETLDTRETLKRRFADYDRQFADQPVPRPPHWSGYRLSPELIEFWLSRPGRMHDRERYLKVGDRWQKRLINP